MFYFFFRYKTCMIYYLLFKFTKIECGWNLLINLFRRVCIMRANKFDKCGFIVERTTTTRIINWHKLFGISCWGIIHEDIEETKHIVYGRWQQVCLRKLYLNTFRVVVVFIMSAKFLFHLLSYEKTYGGSDCSLFRAKSLMSVWYYLFREAMYATDLIRRANWH